MVRLRTKTKFTQVKCKTEIRQVSDTSFVWAIPHFISNIGGEGNDSSPEFQFDQETWYLYYRKRKGEGVICFRLLRVRHDDSIPCTQTYRLCIKDIVGEDYWTSSVMTKEFNDCDNWGTEVEVRASDLQRDAHRIATEGVLTLQLNFESPHKQLQDQGINSADTSSCSTNFWDQVLALPSSTSSGTQTYLDLQANTLSYVDGLVKLSQNLKDLLLSGNKSDVTLNVKGVDFKVHQNILVCRSPVFGRMFDHDMLEQSSGIVQIPDCVPQAFEIFLHYLYTGNLKITSTNVVDLYYIADKYSVKEITADCVSFMVSNLTIESFCDFVSVALQHCEQELLESASSFLADNMKQIMATDKWRGFIVENPAEGNTLLFEALSKVKLMRE